MRQPLTTVDIGLYALGATGIGVLLTAAPLFLVHYLTDVRGIAPGAAAGWLIAPQILDLAIAPLIGILSERSSSVFGKRKPLLVAGMILSAVSMVALFSAPTTWTGTAVAAWTALAFAGLVLGATLFHLAHLALAAEIGADARERERLIAARMGCALFGVLLAGVTGQPVVATFGGVADGFRALSIVLALAIAAFMLAPILGVREPKDGGPGSTPAASPWSSVARNTRFLRLCGGYILQAIGAGLAMAAWPFFATTILGDASAIGALFGASMLASLASFALWPAIARRIGDASAYSAAIATFALGAVGLFLVGAGASPTLGGVIGWAALGGLGIGGLQFLPFKAFAEHAATAGVGAVGPMTGIWVSGEKFGLAAGAAALAGLLAAVGYAPGAPSTGAATIAAVTAFGPLVFYLLSAPGIALGAVVPARARSPA